MTAREYILNELNRILPQFLDPESTPPEIVLEIPSNLNFGDYSTNIAMQVFKKHQSIGMPKGSRGHRIAAKAKDELELAEKIKQKFNLGDIVGRIEIVKPGFINFWLSKDYLLRILNQNL